MKYLILGGCGFIGSHLVERLLKEDCEITIIDDLSEGKLSNLPFDERITFVKASILDDIGEYFKKVDAVFHLAALTRPQWSILHPMEACRTNVEGTINVFKSCVENKVKRVVFVSSSSAYGEQEKYPTKEDAPINPMCPYALNKYEGELYAKLYEKLYGLKVNYIRPFNVYGPRQNPNSPYSAAIPKFIDQIRKGEVSHITGDGKQARDFIYVTDTVEIIYMASKCKEFGEAFNAGYGKNISIESLFYRIKDLMGSKIEPIYVDPVVEPRQTLADMSKVKKVLNWKPSVNLTEGLKKTIYAK